MKKKKKKVCLRGGFSFVKSIYTAIKSIAILKCHFSHPDFIFYLLCPDVNDCSMVRTMETGSICVLCAFKNSLYVGSPAHMEVRQVLIENS